MAGCLDDRTVAALLEKRLEAGRSQAVAEHLERCESCQDLVAEAAMALSSGPASEGRGEGIGPGRRVGRYEVLAAVGAGAMGRVYAARDLELGRTVALKLVRASYDGDAARTSALRARLVREARSLARLSHPNVVAVYDVGAIDDEVFFAMELVEGSTLGAWLAARRRSLDEIVRAFGEAGEGLAAAHEAGLVHRDFKPDNVLVGRDGRVKVTDFGLAQDAGDEGPSWASGGSLDGAAFVTRTGALVGTPAYMAPELFEGQRASASSDQFAFCVSLFEAVAGERPYAAVDLASYRAAASQGRVSAEALRRAPAWLRGPLLRGLGPDPSGRHPSLRSLLPLLRPPRRGLRAAAALLAPLALAPLALGVLWGKRLSAGADAPLCEAERDWGEGWSGPEREAARAAFAASGAAARSFDDVDRALSAYRAAWISARGDACRARDEGRVRCLDQRRREVSSFAAALREPGAAEHAVEGASELTPPSSCGAAAREAARPSDPARAALARRADASLADAEAARLAGLAPAARDGARAALASARELGDRGREARARFIEGASLHDLGDGEGAEAALHGSAAAAQEAGDDALAARAWTMLVRVRGTRPHEFRTWAGYAEAALRRLGGDDRLEAERLAALGQAEAAGRPDEAVALLERARRLFEATVGPRHFRLAGVDQGLANALLVEGKLDEALAAHGRARALREELLGPDHPAVASSLGSEADTLLSLGRPAEALVLLDRALAISSKARPPDGDPTLLVLRAEAYRALDRASAAYDDDQRAVALLSSPEPGPELARPLLGLGRDLLRTGHAADAVAPLDRAAHLRQDSRDSLGLAEARLALAEAFWRGRNDRPRARSLARSARDDLASSTEGSLPRARALLASADALLASLDHPSAPKPLAAGGARPSPESASAARAVPANQGVEGGSPPGGRPPGRK